ncbi:MAG TPA: hypothetical protein VFZ70_14800, partial [Euzebyales bacterium]
MPEHDDSAIAFGQRLLALLDTGSFTASYKYAVLVTLIDAVLEGADGHGDPPAAVHAIDIGRRVLAIYWRQARPFTADGPLRQSRQRDIVTRIDEFRRRHRLDGLVTVEAARRAHPTDFADLERDVVATVVRYPIPLLQKVGIGRRAVEQRFIYAYGWAEGVSAAVVHRSGFDDRMHLVGDAGAHPMALAGLLRPVIQRDWLEFVARRNDADVEELRLHRHLFGGDRVSLGGRAPSPAAGRQVSSAKSRMCSRGRDPRRRPAAPPARSTCTNLTAASCGSADQASSKGWTVPGCSRCCVPT